MVTLDSNRFARNYLTFIEGGDLASASSLLFLWVKAYFSSLPANPRGRQLTTPDLWGCLAQNASISGDRAPVEDFWNWLEMITPSTSTSSTIPLFGIPILTGFPEAPYALLVMNDVVFSPGVLSQVAGRIDPSRPQFLPLLPAPQEFSAFAITPSAWDRVGLFDANFHPAYCEDLDYAERLRACESVEWIAQESIQATLKNANPNANPTASATIASDPRLEACNRSTDLFNCLRLHSRRRLENLHPGTWMRRWLNQWTLEPIHP